MRIFTSIFLLLFLNLCNAQTIQLVNNPDNVNSHNEGGIINFQNSIYGKYIDSITNKIQIIKYNGTTSSLIANPDNGTFLSSGYYKFFNKLFSLYRNQNNETVLAKFDGNTSQLVAIPSNYTFSGYTLYRHNSNIYFTLLNSISGKNHLAKYDDTTLFVFPNPDGGNGVVDNSIIVYNNTVYYGYKNVNAKHMLCKVESNTLTSLPNTTSTALWDEITTSGNNGIEFQNIYFLRVKLRIGSEDTFYLAKFDGNRITRINNPTWDNTSWSWANYSPFLYKNDLYFLYKSWISPYEYAISKFSNNNHNKISLPNPSGSTYSHFWEYNNEMFFSYIDNLNLMPTYTLASFDSLNIVVHNNPEPDFSLFRGSFKNFWNSQFFFGVKQINFNQRIYKIGFFKNNTIKLVLNPDNGSGITGFSDTLNNKLYFLYKNEKNKIQLAYLDASALPLKLLSFTAKQQQNKVLLNWQTAAEENVSHINIERSINNKDFITIGKINAKCCNYSFQDLNLLEQVGIVYYRLEIVDKDGSKTYSSIQKITINTKSSTLRVYPNPSQGNITIEARDINTIEIIDYLGRKIKQQAIQPQATVLNYQLPKGIYFVKANMKAGEFKTEKIVVE